MNASDPSHPQPPFWRSTPGIATGMLLVIALFYLARELYGHVSLLLPYAILLLCPLMHLLGHHRGGHGRHGETDDTTKGGRSG